MSDPNHHSRRTVLCDLVVIDQAHPGLHAHHLADIRRSHQILRKSWTTRVLTTLHQGLEEAVVRLVRTRRWLFVR